jgi:DME family drug/metabolite transporter
MSRILFKEAVTAVKLIALVLTLGGVAGISMSTQQPAQTQSMSFQIGAIGFGLLAGFCYSLYYVIGKHFSDRYSSPNLFAYMLPIGALGLLPWVPFGSKSLTAWGAMACIAGLSTYGAYYCYYKGLQYLEASRASITATLEPVVAAVIAYFWWQERFTAIGYLGSFMILTAVVMMVADPFAKRRNKDGAAGEEA